MTILSIAYPSLCVGFCLGFVAAAVLGANRRRGS